MVVVVLKRQTRFMKTTNELRSQDPCQIQLRQAAGAISYIVRETRLFNEGTRTRATLPGQLPDGILEGWPVYGGRERETRFQFARIRERGHRSVQFYRPLQEGLIAYDNYTTKTNMFIYPTNLPLGKLRILDFI